MLEVRVNVGIQAILNFFQSALLYRSKLDRLSTLVMFLLFSA
jgi:hypothetical protein